MQPNYVPPRDGSSFGFTLPENISFINKAFDELNAKEKELQDQLDAIRNKVPKKINWNVLEQLVPDAGFLKSMKARETRMYQIIQAGINKPPEPEEIDEGPFGEKYADIPQLIEQRAASLEDYIENDINPLLNPYADFWVYERDGPEFAEVFAARPHWNQIINEYCDEMAFVFEKDDPMLDLDLQAQYEAEISKSLEAFEPEEDGMELLKALASGKIAKDIEQYYIDKVFFPTERAKIAEFLEEDNNALALKNGFITIDTNPVGHTFHGH